jgi:hypothetical protein
MASPYGSGGKRGVRRFSGTTSIIEVDDFKREFTMWCELQKSRNPNFNPYMVWRALFGCLERAPLADYGEFEEANLIVIGTWRNFYVLDYADVFGRVPRAGTSNNKGKDKKEERQSEEVLQPPPFNGSTQSNRFLLNSFRITKDRGRTR